ncbi:hypothetical protein ABT034_04250 [Streptomyces sp. NPDC002773]|uniref:hypothetical protein n=1 Tax=Streptomyces sp. NPDC002773 TaxID=3154430 RepID=UPI00332A8487
MDLCPRCEGFGAATPATRDPVLVGDVLAGLVNAAAFTAAVPEPRSGAPAPDTAAPALAACGQCGATPGGSPCTVTLAREV